MDYPVTLAKLKEIVIDQADMTNSAFPNDEKLQYWINAELSELYALLASAFSAHLEKGITQETGSSEVRLETVAGVGPMIVTKLPEDFYQLRSIFIKDSATGSYYHPRSWSHAEWATILNQYEAGESDRYRYKISGGMLYLGPGTVSPPTSYTLIYVPRLKPLSKPTDEVPIDVPFGWEDFVVCGAVARLLGKEESDPSQFLARKAELKSQLVVLAQNVDEGDAAEAIVDVYNRVDDYDSDIG